MKEGALGKDEFHIENGMEDLIQNTRLVSDGCMYVLVSLWYHHWDKRKSYLSNM